jgi:membrane protease YdiL (CAAX protease family)
MSARTQISIPAVRLPSLRRYAERRPVTFSILVTLGFAMALSVYTLFMPQPVDEYPLAVLGFDAVRYAIAIGLLAALGWWRRAGFLTRPTFRRLLPFLPLALLPFLLLLNPRLGTHSPWMIALIVATMLCTGFTEEALFRGVILRALEPLGWMKAALLSSVLFGLIHATGLLTGADPLYIFLQVIWATLVGFAFAAPVLATGWIWPAVVVHFSINAITTLGAGRLVQAEQPDATAIQGLLAVIAVFALLAVYGYLLLVRTARMRAAGN